MRWTRAPAVAALALVACGTSVTAETATFSAGLPFTLKAGEQAHWADQNLRVGFDGVLSDSRCPKGEQCVWAGDATVRVWFQQGSGLRQTRELHTASGALQGAPVLDQVLRLVRLDPIPVKSRTIDKSEYAATFLLSRGSAAEAER